MIGLCMDVPVRKRSGGSVHNHWKTHRQIKALLRPQFTNGDDVFLQTVGCVWWQSCWQQVQTLAFMYTKCVVIFVLTSDWWAIGSGSLNCVTLCQVHLNSIVIALSPPSGSSVLSPLKYCETGGSVFQSVKLCSTCDQFSRLIKGQIWNYLF